MRRLLLAASLIFALSPALGQAPPPVPALPDTIRQTSYSILTSTCACAVGFQIYGDQTDIQNWLVVKLNGTTVTYNDPTYGWGISSPSGALGNIARPITDAVLTFNLPQTGTVTIIGAQRPRRLSTFSENQGVSARQLNQVINTLFAELRELWDKTIGAAPVVVGVRSSNASVVTASASSDYFLCLDPSSNAIQVNLPASPQVGLSFLIKDCTGTSATHAITVTAGSSMVDGTAHFLINANFESIAVTYTGAQWSVN
jgi:hypothetical protein